MAENPLLPGTDIEVVEKYAPGKRLDFPDFGSVCKTTFAKGVIADFKKTNDDPITVASMVKVTVEGKGESDYIPLFYHPKKLYWDGKVIVDGISVDTGEVATNYSEGSFTGSWRSFRIGDEVIVMLSEGKPVAVLGFADGKPKIGENILKVTSSFPDYYFHALVMPKVLYEGKEKGPDGKPLRLTLPVRDITLDPPPPVLTISLRAIGLKPSPRER